MQTQLNLRFISKVKLEQIVYKRAVYLKPESLGFKLHEWPVTSFLAPSANSIHS
jgi:hypothetical protein